MGTYVRSVGDGLTEARLEQIRRSIVMSPSVTGPVAQEMLDEVHRLRSHLVALVAEVDGLVLALRRVQERAGNAL